ncbi:MAG TPA: NAD(P)-binding domain-containing protein [Syntrophorhabdaceae bacterium]|mgnify:FL=1|nr:NAD(P)-binding domain-containing protein [Syntrophorhabdaceae bacterium]HRV23431.1 NAD(P)-binding domain-containing protein [Syntrophorhabdaceae bacterium]
MIDRTFGFIGGGRITRILLGGLKRADKIPENIVVADINAEILNKVKAEFEKVVLTQDNKEAAKQDVVIVALHPPMIPDVLKDIKDSLKFGSILISLAPKPPIEMISAMLGGFQRIARLLPGAPSIVNKGYNPVVFSTSFSESEKDELMSFFRIFGECFEVAEEKIPAYAVCVTGGPNYLWFQLYELMELGKSFGLSKQEIERGIAGMVQGAVATMCDAGLSAGEVMDLIPMKPFAEEEARIKSIYRSKIQELYQKLKP